MKCRDMQITNQQEFDLACATYEAIKADGQRKGFADAYRGLLELEALGLPDASDYAEIEAYEAACAEYVAIMQQVVNAYFDACRSLLEQGFTFLDLEVIEGEEHAAFTFCQAGFAPNGEQGEVA